jgi:hypothetical protein
MKALPVITKDQEINDLKKHNSKLREQLAKALEAIVELKVHISNENNN